jgi:hypothetical protein
MVSYVSSAEHVCVEAYSRRRTLDRIIRKYLPEAVSHNHQSNNKQALIQCSRMANKVTAWVSKAVLTPLVSTSSAQL